MKVAFLHVEPRAAQVETNRKLIERLISTAAKAGASWILTPELCIPGYYFADVIGSDWIKPQPDEWMRQLMAVSRKKRDYYVSLLP